MADHTPQSVIQEFADDAASDAATTDREVLAAVAKLRASLDAVENAIMGNLNVPSSASGRAFAQGDAEDLVQALNDRRNAYATLVQVSHIQRRIAKAGA